MTWGLVIFAAAGFLLGLRYRIAILVPATLVALIWALVGHSGIAGVVALPLAAALGYLAGLATRTLLDG